MVKLRVEGTTDEVQEFVTQLKALDIPVLQESDEYKNRNSVYVRKYLDISMEKPKKNTKNNAKKQNFNKYIDNIISIPLE